MHIYIRAERKQPKLLFFENYIITIETPHALMKL